MTRALSEVKPFGVYYCGMLTVVSAIEWGHRSSG
jgi:hypothetical protein